MLSTSNLSPKVKNIEEIDIQKEVRIFKQNGINYVNLSDLYIEKLSLFHLVRKLNIDNIYLIIKNCKFDYVDTKTDKTFTDIETHSSEIKEIKFEQELNTLMITESIIEYVEIDIYEPGINIKKFNLYENKIDKIELYGITLVKSLHTTPLLIYFTLT